MHDDPLTLGHEREREREGGIRSMAAAREKNEPCATITRACVPVAEAGRR